LFGIRIWVVWVVQALVHAMVVAWVWRLVDIALRGLDGDRWARLVPVALYAVHPDIVQNNAMLMADSLFSFLFVGAVMALLPYLEVKAPTGLGRPAAIGALIGTMAMVKPTGLPLFVAVLALFAWRRLWKAMLASVCCFVLVQTPWAMRNLRTYDHFIYNSVVGSVDIWVGLYPGGDGTFDMDSLHEIRERKLSMDPDELDRVAIEETKKIVRERPLFALQRTASKFFKLFALTKTSGFWFHYRGAIDHVATVALSVLFNLVLLGLAAAALVHAGWKRVFDRPILWACLLAIGLLSAAPTVSVVVNRYRLPMLPFITVLAAYWLAAVRDKKERLITLAGGFGFLTFCTGVDLSGSWHKVAERLGRISAR
jgi:hypothetical protein